MCPSRSFRFLTSSLPYVSFSVMSTIARSGCNWPISFSAVTESSASPHTSRSASCPISSASRSRTIGWSSTRNTLRLRSTLAGSAAAATGAARARAAGRGAGGLLLLRLLPVRLAFVDIRIKFFDSAALLRAPPERDSADDDRTAALARPYVQPPADDPGAVDHRLHSDPLAAAA